MPDVKHTTIPEIEDVTRIATQIAHKLWEEYKDDDNITVGEIMKVIISKVPTTIMEVNFKEFANEIKGFKMKDHKWYFRNSFINLVWTALYNITE